MKKSFVIFVCFMLLFPLLLNTKSVDYAFAEDGNEDIVKQIDEDTQKQLNNIDFSPLQKILDGFTKNQLKIFGGGSFYEKVRKLLNGEFDDSGGVWRAIIDCIFATLIDIMPIISLIVAIALIGSMVQGIRPNSNGKSVSNRINRY